MHKTEALVGEVTTTNIIHFGSSSGANTHTHTLDEEAPILAVTHK